MWRGPVVAGRKAVQDKARGKVFALHAKLIAIAARWGGNPDDNPSLRDAIEKARKDSVPKDTIDRAIKRGTGEDKEGSEIHEILYEWYGPGGVAIIAKSLTDNKNRTAANMRSIFSKNSGNLGETGSLSAHVFTLTWVIKTSTSWEDAEMMIMESGANDYEADENGFIVYTSREQLSEVAKKLKEANLAIASSSLEFLPNNEVEITDFDQALKVVKLLEDLSDDEDVEKFWTNATIDDILREKVDTFIDEHTFQT